MCIADGGCACALLIRLTCAGYTSLRSVAAAQSASRTLRILDASHNVLFNGSLPSIFGKLPELRSLRLADCNFSGSIPGARRRATRQALSLHIEDPAGAWGHGDNSTPRPLQVQTQGLVLSTTHMPCAPRMCQAPHRVVHLQPQERQPGDVMQRHSWDIRNQRAGLGAKA